MANDTPMTDERLAEIRRRAIHATEGPWVCETAENDFDCHFTVRSTSHFAEHPWSPRYVAWLNGVIRAASIEQIRQQTCPTCGYFIHNHRLLQVGADVRIDNNMRDDAEFIAHAREDIPALLAEVKRLRAENAAMRPIVEAVAHGVSDSETGDCGFCGWSGYPHEGNCPVAQAEAFLAAHPAQEGGE